MEGGVHLIVCIYTSVWVCVCARIQIQQDAIIQDSDVRSTVYED